MSQPIVLSTTDPNILIDCYIELRFQLPYSILEETKNKWQQFRAILDSNERLPFLESWKSHLTLPSNQALPFINGPNKGGFGYYGRRQARIKCLDEWLGEKEDLIVINLVHGLDHWTYPEILDIMNAFITTIDLHLGVKMCVATVHFLPLSANDNDW
jgi:hypothetical protein